MQRTMPRDVLLSAAFELRTGESYDLPEVAYFLETFMDSFSLTLDELK